MDNQVFLLTCEFLEFQKHIIELNKIFHFNQGFLLMEDVIKISEHLFHLEKQTKRLMKKYLIKSPHQI